MEESVKDRIVSKLTQVYCFLELLSSLSDDKTIEPVIMSTIATSYLVMQREAIIAFVEENENSASD